MSGNKHWSKSGASPTISRFINSLGHAGDGFSTKLAKGCTTNEVPITIKRSHLAKSLAWRLKKRSGNDSPKKTILGFTRPLYFSAKASQPTPPSSIAARKSSN
eukprot:gnl/MRDRNA2_/MRDRNA2_58834_c0_seq2.p1 gnl/MRDRNA2_/MRDRNA2_58834_c0~~gnl/MRDRNA2_/MRDRNA2_58834_c0_seq2.p1  ORF type:complete len:103 (-),score=5.99 gnl/MRDRNA2_/MRDRNA2_58834_c0_seq2:11-319(-)